MVICHMVQDDPDRTLFAITQDTQRDGLAQLLLVDVVLERGELMVSKLYRTVVFYLLDVYAQKHVPFFQKTEGRRKF